MNDKILSRANLSARMGCPKRRSPFAEFGAVIIGLNDRGHVAVIGCRPKNIRQARHRHALSDALVMYVPDCRLARRLAAQTRDGIDADSSAEDACRAFKRMAASLRVTIVMPEQIKNAKAATYQ